MTAVVPPETSCGSTCSLSRMSRACGDWFEVRYNGDIIWWHDDGDRLCCPYDIPAYGPVDELIPAGWCLMKLDCLARVIGRAWCINIYSSSYSRRCCCCQVIFHVTDLYESTECRWYADWEIHAFSIYFPRCHLFRPLCIWSGDYLA